MAKTREKIEEERRREIIERAFDKAAPEIKAMTSNLIEDMFFWEEQIAKLKKFPMIEHHPRDKKRTRPSAASRQLERAQLQYANIVKSLITIFNRSGASEDDDLLAQMVKEFEA